MRSSGKLSQRLFDRAKIQKSLFLFDLRRCTQVAAGNIKPIKIKVLFYLKLQRGIIKIITHY